MQWAIAPDCFETLHRFINARQYYILQNGLHFFEQSPEKFKQGLKKNFWANVWLEIEKQLQTVIKTVVFF